MCQLHITFYISEISKFPDLTIHSTFSTFAQFFKYILHSTFSTFAQFFNYILHSTFSIFIKFPSTRCNAVWQSDDVQYIVHYTFFTAELKMSSWRKCIYILHFAFSSMGQKRVVTILHTTFYISRFHVSDYILHSTFATSSVCWNYILHSTYSISGRAPTFVIYICRSEK